MLHLKYEESNMLKIIYFASLREQLGRAGDTLEISTPINILEAWQQATGLEAFSDNLLVAVNQEYTTVEAMVADGDEIAFFPPVTGG